MKILITGGNGYIAKSLYKSLKDKHDITTISREDFNLTDLEDTKHWFYDRRFDVVIHTAVVGGTRLKDENSNILDQNLKMYYNLLHHNHKFTKLINFGSGAEFINPPTPYGLSKQVIAKSMEDKPNFYNLRIYGVFDENEWDTRFIKTCIKNHIEKKPMEIFENKYMDFIYMKDLISVVERYIEKDGLPKDIDLVYYYKYSLRNIAEMINSVGDYPIHIESPSEYITRDSYIGNEDDDLVKLNIPLIGLFQGIKETYNKIKDEY